MMNAGEAMEPTVLEKLNKVPDYRRGNAIKHVLSDILMVGLLTFLCNGDGYAAMHIFGVTHEQELKKFLFLPHGIPSQDTFEHVFAKLNPKALAAVLREYVSDIKTIAMNNGYKKVLAGIDGKTLRGSKGADKRAKHVVTAFASELRLILGELAVDEKSNEITAIPKLLEMFCQKGMIITIDAMGTQTDIAETIIKKKADYVLSVKKNQPTLFNDVSLAMEALEYAATTETKAIMKAHGLYERTAEKGHGRYEVRECYICCDLSLLSTAHDWSGIKGFGMIVSNREELGSTKKLPTVNREYFIYSIQTPTAADMLHIKRTHWAIENNLHWCLDVILKEDSSRARTDNSPENLNILRKEALQLVRADTSFVASAKSKIFRCSLSLDYALSVVGVK